MGGEPVDEPERDVGQQAGHDDGPGEQKHHEHEPAHLPGEEKGEVNVREDVEGEELRDRPDFIGGVDHAKQGEERARGEEEVDRALEKEGAEGRGLFAGERIVFRSHGRAALVVDEEARALDGPEEQARQIAEHKADEGFLDEDEAVEGHPGSRDLPHLGQRGDDGGMEHEVTGEDDGGPQLARENVAAHERRDLHQHEQPGHPHEQREQVLVDVQFLKEGLIFHGAAPWRCGRGSHPPAAVRAVLGGGCGREPRSCKSG